MNPKVSVIVPVYKAEMYLHRCVDSILAQTFTEFEVLLIDDGSPDRSGEICDEYAKKDSRVRVFHKENGGVSSARQCGIDKAQGEYTIHADPDDWVEPNMLEELYAKAKEDEADMVMCDYYEDIDNTQKYHRCQPSALDNETVLKELFQGLPCSCCNKLVRRSCYIDNNISFDLELYYCEDLLFNASLLLHKLQISYLPKAFYHYVRDINTNSIVHSLANSYNEQTYEYDMMLLNKFQEKFQGTVAETVAESRISYNALTRSFFGNFYDSKTFKNKFGNMLPLLMKCGNRGFLFYLYVLSCIGVCGFSYFLFFFGSSINKIIM